MATRIRRPKPGPGRPPGPAAQHESTRRVLLHLVYKWDRHFGFVTGGHASDIAKSMVVEYGEQLPSDHQWRRRVLPGILRNQLQHMEKQGLVRQVAGDPFSPNPTWRTTDLGRMQWETMIESDGIPKLEWPDD